jgi:group II intron reverse transcriptase/maturase
MSPKLERVAELARKDPGLRFQTLVHLLDVDALGRAFARLDGHAAVGVDGVTKEQFGQHLEDNLVALRARMRAAQYRHQPIQRVHIPKASGETRPIGISSVEDKLVQGALCEVLGAIYEQDFLPCSFGFRPGRSAHDALRALNRAVWVDGAQVILEADVQSFFDSVDRKALMEMLRERIVDEPFLRFIGKCLHVGVLDGAEFSTPEDGTVQGSILSPMLGNIYLHHVLDRWFQVEVKPRLGGRAELIRYADDFVIAFHRRADAEWVMGELRQRMARFKLRLHPDKTRLVSFPRPGGGPGGGGNPETFDFLGFTVHWQRGQNRGPSLGFKTRTARLRRALSSVTAYCRSRRHDAVKEQYAGLCRRLEGHMNYFGVNSNIGCIHALVEGARKAWRKWLDRRSQRGRMNWARYEELLVRFPLPLPTIRVRLWA